MSKKRILVIDDDVDLSQTVATGLQNAGPYEVTVENDPREAVAAAKRVKPDGIILDVIMPYKDGGTVAAEIREVPGFEDARILFLTSIIDKQEAALKGGMMGGAPVLAKPVEVEELVDALEGLFRATGA